MSFGGKNMEFRKLALGAGMTLALSILSACGGGGGGGSIGTGGGGSSSGGGSVGDSADIVRYPYETVFGDACTASKEPTPGCTFVRATGLRVTVSADPTYDSQGYGSDDVWYVKFANNGDAVVYDDLGNPQKTVLGNIKTYKPSDFAGYIAGTASTIGVGVTGAFWEDVAGKTYWFGKNGVLYSANTGDANYGQAINNKDATKVTNTNSKALKSSANRQLIMAGAKALQEKGLPASKAVAVASAMNSMAVMSSERGAILENDANKAFTALSGGVEIREAIAAFKSFAEGDKQAARELVNRSANAFGLTPSENEAYLKNLYRASLAKQGFDVDQISLKD
jgi:hypothetical protein